MNERERLDRLLKYRPFLLAGALLLFGLNCLLKLRKLHVLAELAAESGAFVPQPFTWPWIQIVLLQPLVILAIMVAAILLAPPLWSRWLDRR